jgi:hypothetical protein
LSDDADHLANFPLPQDKIYAGWWDGRDSLVAKICKPYTQPSKIKVVVVRTKTTSPQGPPLSVYGMGGYET